MSFTVNVRNFKYVYIFSLFTPVKTYKSQSPNHKIEMPTTQGVLYCIPAVWGVTPIWSGLHPRLLREFDIRRWKGIHFVTLSRSFLLLLQYIRTSTGYSVSRKKYGLVKRHELAVQIETSSHISYRALHLSCSYHILWHMRILVMSPLAIWTLFYFNYFTTFACII